MAELVDGALATGNNSFTPGQTPPVICGGSEPWGTLRLDQNNDDDSGDNDGNSDGDNDDMIDPALRKVGSQPPSGEAAAANIDTPPAVSGDDPTINEEAPGVHPFELDRESQ
jgi:hypothetical protein